MQAMKDLARTSVTAHQNLSGWHEDSKFPGMTVKGIDYTEKAMGAAIPKPAS